MFKLRTFDCLDCGAETTRRLNTDELRVCYDCGLDRATRGAREMAARSGPAWDRFMMSAGPRGAGAHKHREK